ncbi:MAG: prepilin-type N-terminal cleavage/methylation domain-containing protein [Acidimicrobiia bacterium]|jgi:type IV pilus assembly protein PilA|nr:prepilin-type N-terminal cleavage/methylation domain-containing protein [Acidimicrobiia bacterium]
MLKAMRSRLNKDEGFTLIELMVVVLIIAILVAIAIPTFLGQRKNAQDSAAKSNVRNALATEKAYFSVNQEFSADVDELAAIEPNLFKTNGTDASDDPVTATVATDTAGTAVAVCLTQQSDSGVHFAVWDGTTAGTTYYQSATAAPPACATAQPSGADWSTGGW